MMNIVFTKKNCIPYSIANEQIGTHKYKRVKIIYWEIGLEIHAFK